MTDRDEHDYEPFETRDSLIRALEDAEAEQFARDNSDAATEPGFDEFPQDRCMVCKALIGKDEAHDDICDTCFVDSGGALFVAPEQDSQS